MADTSQPAQPTSEPWLPVNILAFGKWLLGDRTGPKREDFSQVDLDTILRSIEEQITTGQYRRGHTMGQSVYGWEKPANLVGFYGDKEPRAGGEILKQSLIDPYYRLYSTLGNAQFDVSPTGYATLRDAYDFGNWEKSALKSLTASPFSGNNALFSGNADVPRILEALSYAIKSFTSPAQEYSVPIGQLSGPAFQKYKDDQVKFPPLKGDGNRSGY